MIFFSYGAAIAFIASVLLYMYLLFITNETRHFFVVIDKPQMCFKVAVLKISQNILLMQLLKHVKSSVWIMREISSFFLNSPCSFSSSARTKKFGSDQIGLGPQRLPRLLFFTEEGRITCHPSVCTCSPSSYLSILHLLHQILLLLHLLLVCFIFFFHVFILSSFHLSSCSAV